jgi:hypothetical protein
MHVHDIQTIVCPRCAAELDAGDNFCRHCGSPTAAGAALSAKDRPAAKAASSRLVVLTMVFAVAGPLALPMLWRSPHFSLPWKIALSVLVTALTVAVLVGLWYVLTLTSRRIEEIQRLSSGQW